MKGISPAEFDTFVLENHPEANFLQSAAWGKVYELTGHTTYYLGFPAAEKSSTQPLSGACLAIVKDARRGRYLEIPGGPLLDWTNSFALKTMLLNLRTLARKEHCAFVRLRPNIFDTPENRKIAKSAGLKLAPFHLHAEHTVILDLTKSEADLLSDMRRQTRYEIRRAEKLGLSVDISITKTAFADFHAVQTETAVRQGFVPSPENFIFAEHSAFAKKAKLYISRQGSRPLAYGLFIFHGLEADYFEAASTPDGRNFPGAYALIWKAIKDAKKAGLKRLNLFGIAPPNSPNHRYAGVTTFKKGFGGDRVSYLPAHDLVVSPLKYQLAKTVELARKKRRHL